MEATVQIGFRGTEDYRFHVQELARRRRMKVQQFLELAVATMESGAIATPAVSAEVSGNGELAAAIEALVREWRRGSEKWKFVAAELSDEGVADEEAHAKGRTHRPSRTKAG